MNNAPLIDDRTREMIVLQARELALKYTKGWVPQDEEDPGLTMIHLFSRLMEVIINRLNQVPEKNFLTFLDVAGVTPLAPNAAKAPVQFLLPAGAKEDGFVPKGTPLATAPTDKEEEPVPFETEKGLVLTRSQLNSLFAYDPLNDQYNDLDAVLKSNEKNDSMVFTPFTGDRLIPHKFYIAHDTLLNINQATDVTITFSLDNSNNPNDYMELFGEKLTWLIKVGDSDKPIETKNVRVDTSSPKNDIIVEFKEDKEIERVDKTKVWDKEHYWLWAETKTALEPDWADLIITSIKVSTVTQGILPELAFSNAIALDTTREYYPFGERPKLFDTFFLAIPEALTKEGSKITIGFYFLPGVSPQGIVLTWEFWNDTKWETLGVTSGQGVINNDGHNFLDFTNALNGVQFDDKATPSKPTLGVVALQDGVKLVVSNATSGDSEKFKLAVTDGTNGLEPPYDELTIETFENRINGISQSIVVKNLGSPSVSPENRPKNTARKKKIDIPFPLIEFICPKIEKTKVNGKENYWIRARITSGNYGEDAKMIKTGTGDPPTLADWEYKEPTYEPPVINSIKVSYGYDDPRPVTSCLAYTDFSYKNIALDGDGFQPFTPAEGTSSALYLGFDQSFSNKSVSIYISVEEQRLESQPIVVWEYRSSDSWKNLGIQDGTKNLTESGFIEFIGPNYFEVMEKFEKKQYWIRARLEQGDPCIKLLGIYPNTILAVNASTVTNEVLGSSAETPNAAFQFSRFPVLEGQIIHIQEPEKPSDDDQVILKDKVEQETSPATNENSLQEHWVQWQEVDHFRFSSEKDRHYTINRSTGQITFGDGVHGMVPPAGRENIKAIFYQAGGGEQGNVARNTITVLKKAIPFVDAVRNVAGSGGGSDDEPLDHVKTRGPQAIKHRDRAVTWEDFEWLAKEASFQVARVRCLPAKNANDAGNVTLILVPQSENGMPYPSEGLIRQVKEYLTTRLISTIDLIVVGPNYTHVSVKAIIEPTNPEEVDFVQRQVKKNLEEFFHPLRGGPDGTGWEFGRNVYVSEVYKVIEDTEGVDYVESAMLFDGPQTGEDPQGQLKITIDDDHLVASGTHKVKLSEIPGTVEVSTANSPNKVLLVEQQQYLGNAHSMELHDFHNIKANCHIDSMSEKNKRYFSSKEEALEMGYDLCAWCFGRDSSKR